YNFQLPLTSAQHQDSLQTRINKSIKRKDNLVGMFAMQSTRSDNTSIFSFLDTTSSLGMTTNVNWMHRISSRMFLTTGVNYRRQQFNLLSQQNPRGTFQFTGQATGSDFAGFLLGIPDSSQIAFGNADKYFRAGSYDAGFTDDWRMSPSLTINAGIRWEYNSP